MLDFHEMYVFHKAHSCRLNFGGSRSAHPIKGMWGVIMSAVDFWSRHLAACQVQRVSINAYAKREGLSAVSLYYWRKRLGLAGARPRDVVASPFVPIQVERSGDCAGSCQLILGDGGFGLSSRKCLVRTGLLSLPGCIRGGLFDAPG